MQPLEQTGHIQEKSLFIIKNLIKICFIKSSKKIIHSTPGGWSRFRLTLFSLYPVSLYSVKLKRDELSLFTQCSRALSKQMFGSVCELGVRRVSN